MNPFHKNSSPGIPHGFYYPTRLTIFALLAICAVSSLKAQVSPFPATEDTVMQRDTVQGIGTGIPVFHDTTVSRLEIEKAATDSAGITEDTLEAPPDTLWKEDPSEDWRNFTDSAARVTHFIHDRYDAPMVDMFPPSRYPLYLGVTSPAYVREVVIDSAGESVTVRERVNGLDVKIPTAMPFGEYVRTRFEYEKRKSWRNYIVQAAAGKKKDDLSNLLGSLTNISIVVPSNPISNIFGGTENNLRISGGVDIRGAFRNTTSDQSTISRLDRSRNEPDFNQNVQVNVSGTIGKKLNILADWNTQRTFEYENQLKIKYTGFDDEIIQSIEAGNVSLQTPSLVGGGQALFGIKAKVQAGPLTLTSLLSQKKGETKEMTITGGSQTNEVGIFPYNYSRRHFFIDTLYAKFYESLHKSIVKYITDEIQANRVNQIDVYLSYTGNQVLRGGNYFYGKAYVDLPPTVPNVRYTSAQIDGLLQSTGRFDEGYFVRLEQNKDYKYDEYEGTITMLTSVNDNQTIAVQYSTGDGSLNKIFGGTMEGNDTLQFFKLVKPKATLLPSYKPAWDLLLKNIYSVNATNLKKEGFDLKIYRNETGAADVDEIYSVPLLTVLGLDRFNNQDNSQGADNNFDFIAGLTIDPELGEIIFPSLRPFDSTIVRYFREKGIAVDDSLIFSEVYDTTTTGAQGATTKNKYQISVKAAGAQSSRFNLGGMNLVEGSVHVLLNGTPLTPNVDYTIDYIIGEVVIRKPEALIPGANLQIKYEQNDLFQLASKTLMGARGEIDALPNTKLGFTLMNLNQETLSDKVRLGEEPTNNLMIGTDISTSAELPFLTDLIDGIPLIRTKEMSTWRFGGEGAYMIPDANTKKSVVASDGGASIAYIDDFEGARRTIPLPVNYTAWSLSSPAKNTYLGEGKEDSTMIYSKARLVWYNRLPTDVVTQDIWPNRRTRQGQNQVTVLNLDFNPNHRGIYNFSPNLDSTLHRADIGEGTGKYDLADERRKNWNGVMRYIGSTGGSLLEQNMAYIEVWMKATSGSIEDLRRGRLYIDIGRISEDVIPRELNTEDTYGGLPNGVLNEGEDVGLDMLDNNGERVAYAGFLSANAGDPDVDPGDPGGDNWRAYGDGTDLVKFNGTEDNKNDPVGLLPNTEDLNGNGSVDRVNHYIEYEIPLDTAYFDYELHRDTVNTLIVGGGQKGWYQFRIPLLDTTRVVPPSSGSAREILQNIQYIRLWASGFSEPVNIRIAEISFVGSQWQERTKNDSLLKISVVNIEDNPEYNAEWPVLGIVREKDRSDPNQIIEGNEQSLALILNGLPPGQSREVFKPFTVRALDIFNYKSMKMFVHGDKSFSPSDAEVYLRFGADTVNFYEYREKVYPGWDPQKNEIKILFSQLTSLKATRDSVNRITYDTLSNGSMYGVRGNPSLRQIREITIGVTNKSVKALNGQIWVNELRLVDVDNSPGMAYSFNTQLKLADLGQVSFNFARRDPNFHGLDQRFGSRTTNINWAVNANLTLDRFFPQEWQGTTVPFTYSHSENLAKPQYLPNTDIVVEEAANRAAPDASKTVILESQTLNIRDSYAVPNLKIVFPSKKWYIRDTFNKLSFAFNYNTTYQRDPSIAIGKSWQWNLRMNYGVSLPPDYYIQPFSGLFDGIFLLEDYKDWKFYYIPLTGLSAGIGGQRSYGYQLARLKNSPARENRAFGVNKSFGFGWKLTEGGLSNITGDYGLSTDRNLLPFDNDSVGRGIGSLLKSLFFRGTDNRYNQKFTVNLKPKIPDILDIPKYFDATAGYSVNYAWQNTFQGVIGKSAGWNNNISLSFSFRLKSLADPWFASEGEEPKGKQVAGKTARRDRGRAENAKDSIVVKDTSGSAVTKKGYGNQLLSQLKNVSRYLIKIPLLDYESISISYSQSNRSGNAGVIGTTGFQNFWARLPFQGSLDEHGPSRLYQLGLITDPHGKLEFEPKSKFPFLGWKTVRGLRAPGGQYTDQFSQSNNIALRTNRPLWPGASIDLNWKVGWQYNRSIIIRSDSLGNQILGEPVTSGSVERSYLTIPPFLLFKSFKSNLENVGKKYQEYLKTDPADVALVRSFEEGFEALPFLRNIIGEYVPRPNWTLRWDGIEKLFGLNSVFDRLSLEHAYNSTFRRSYRSYPGKGERTDAERMNYGFTPVAGLTMGFKQVLKGNLSGNFRYNSTTNYDLNLAASQPNIISALSQEMALTLTYSRRGFSFPLFGLNLSNDLDVSFTYSLTKSSRRRYDPELLTSNQEGVPQDGNTRTVLEPRIRYVLSSRVTAALYYKYSKTEPDATGSAIFGITTNEAGIDIHISI